MFRVAVPSTLRQRLLPVCALAPLMVLPGSLPSALEGSTGERNIGDFYVWGSGISFVVGAADGSAQRVIYHGLIEGDRITGVAHDGGTLVPWIAERQQQRP